MIDRATLARIVLGSVLLLLLLALQPAMFLTTAATAAQPPSPLLDGPGPTDTFAAPTLLPVVEDAGLGETAALPGTVLYFPFVARHTLIYVPFVSFSVAPENPMPADLAAEVSLNAYLTWSIPKLIPETEYRYDLYLNAAANSPTTLVAANLANPWFEPATFDPGITYAWQVVAIDSRTGARLPGPIWRFTTANRSGVPPLDAMVTVPGGPFWMGCDRSNPAEGPCSYNIFHYDEPVRAVNVDTFRIDAYEVTNREYRACMAAGACNRPRRTEMLNDGAFSTHPVVYVSWWDAQNFCAWEGKRLPTEAEWEKAARGAIDTRTWPWGNEAPDCTRLNSTFYDDVGSNCTSGLDTQLQPVGQYPRGMTPYGAYDMSGNAFEWVQDKYDVYYYVYGPVDNPQGPPFSRITRDQGQMDRPLNSEQLGHPVFSIRGGSFRDNPTYLRIAHRHWGHHGDTPNTDPPYYRNVKTGFRCAVSVE